MKKPHICAAVFFYRLYDFYCFLILCPRGLNVITYYYSLIFRIFGFFCDIDCLIYYFRIDFPQYFNEFFVLASVDIYRHNSYYGCIFFCTVIVDCDCSRFFIFLNKLYFRNGDTYYIEGKG